MPCLIRPQPLSHMHTRGRGQRASPSQSGKLTPPFHTHLTQVIYGGQSFTHSNGGRCYDDSVLVFDLSCDQWLSRQSLVTRAIQDTAPRGRIHATLTATIDTTTPSTAVLVGGYTGLYDAAIVQLRFPAPCHARELSNCTVDVGCEPCTLSNESGQSQSLCLPVGAPCTSESEQVQAAQAAIASSASCDAPKACERLGDCFACASRDDCAWLYLQGGALAGLSGSCVAEAAVGSLSPSNRAALIRNGSLCDFCGKKPSCTSCAGSADPSVGGADGACGWYEVSPFRYHFCMPGSSPVAGVPGVRFKAEQCPAPCSVHQSCGSCSSAFGCEWCEAAHECQESQLVAQINALGQCLRHDNDNRDCPRDCSSYTECGSCLQAERCGWCVDPQTGRGSCTEGGPLGAHTLLSACAGVPDARGALASFTGLAPREQFTVLDFVTPIRDGAWSYFACPDVNECDKEQPCALHASCENLEVYDAPALVAPVGFACTCFPGYSGDGEICAPTCAEGTCNLESGRCVAPDVCECLTGFRGSNCSLDCGCNRHSACSGDGTCLECIHNTGGERCQFCLPGFFGDATQGTAADCRPCEEVCNGHTERCVSSLSEAVDGVVCQGCSADSHAGGAFCDDCASGYFRSDPGNGQIECLPCTCNGHGRQCNAETGLDCECDPWTHTVTLVPLEPCGACKPGYVRAGASPTLLFAEPCYTPLRLSEPIENTTLGAVGARALHAVVLSPELQAVDPVTAGGLNLHLNIASGRVNVIVSTREVLDVLQAEELCSAKEECLALACTPESCQPISLVEDGLPSSPSDMTQRVRRDQLETDDGRRPFRAETVTVPLPCDVFDLLGERLYISVIAVGSAPARLEKLLVEAAVVPSAGLDPNNMGCAACLGCALPCSPGFFQDPDRPFLCQPCRCNGHGDRCNVLTGGSCGVAAEGCDIVTGARCSCADNTVSIKPRDGLRPFEYQCNRCAGRGTPGVDVTLTGTPLDGRQCYQTVSSLRVEAATQGTPGQSAQRAFFFQIKPDRYTNVDLRITVDVFAGSVLAAVSLDDSVTLRMADNGSLQGRSLSLSQATVERKHLASRRHVFVLDDAKFNFAADAFYVSVLAESGDAAFSIWSQQNLTRIELTVFFNVFFSVFFLLLVSLIVVAKVRQRMRRVQRQQEQQQQLVAMSRRANASVTLMLGTDLPADVQDQILLDGPAAYARSASDLPNHLRQWCVPTPLAVQPLLSSAGEQRAVATYVVELPGLVAPSLQLGVVLTEERRSSRHSKKRRQRKVAPEMATSAF